MIARTDHPQRIPIGTSVEFELPRPVASSKNRRRLFARGRRVLSLPSEQAESDAALIAMAARVAANGLEFSPDDALRIDYWHVLETDRMRVRVTKVGELPQRNRGTRRDVHGMAETIADALQGVLYPNDNQVDGLSALRVRP